MWTISSFQLAGHLLQAQEGKYRRGKYLDMGLSSSTLINKNQEVGYVLQY